MGAALRAFREKIIDKEGTFDDFTDNVTTNIDPVTGEEISTERLADGTIIEIRYDLNTGKVTQTKTSKVPKPDGGTGSDTVVHTSIKDPETGLHTRTETVNGRLKTKVVTNLYDGTEVSFT